MTGPAIVTYSRKLFLPLTHLCRDVCHYCTFATTPSKAGPAYLSREEVLAIARAGAANGCREALFTLGDRPERLERHAFRACDQFVERTIQQRSRLRPGKKSGSGHAFAILLKFHHAATSDREIRLRCISLVPPKIDQQRPYRYWCAMKLARCAGMN